MGQGQGLRLLMTKEGSGGPKPDTAVRPHGSVMDEKEMSLTGPQKIKHSPGVGHVLLWDPVLGSRTTRKAWSEFQSNQKARHGVSHQQAEAVGRTAGPEGSYTQLLCGLAVPCLSVCPEIWDRCSDQTCDCLWQHCSQHPAGEDPSTHDSGRRAVWSSHALECWLTVRRRMGPGHGPRWPHTGERPF